MMYRDTDGYGCAIEEYLNGRTAAEVIERDDGWIEVSRGAPAYFAEFKDWPDRQRDAAEFASGRILDVGCGAGRVALHFQELGHDVVGIDVSPRAVSVCRQRGVSNPHRVCRGRSRPKWRVLLVTRTLRRPTLRAVRNNRGDERGDRAT